MSFPARLTGAKIALFIDYSFEDLVRPHHSAASVRTFLHRDAFSRSDC